MSSRSLSPAFSLPLPPGRSPRNGLSGRIGLLSRLGRPGRAGVPALSKQGSRRGRQAERVRGLGVPGRRGMPAVRRGRLAIAVALAALSVAASPAAATAAVAVPSGGSQLAAHAGGNGAHALEAAASRAGQTGRNVAMSLIGLALSVAAVVLAFRRDFKEAAAVFAVGLVCILFATPSGVGLLHDTVKALVGG